MLTHCPECQKELSTQATQCPHCGAPVAQGNLASKAPMAQPVQPGYGQPPMAQPGYAQPAYGQPGPQQPQSHCFRNCLLVGCLLVVLLGGAFVGVTYYAAKKLTSSFTTTPAQVTAIGQKVAPGATTPTGYQEKFAVDFDFFGNKAQGAFISNGSGDPNSSTIIAWGALNAKPQDQKDLQAKFQQALANAGKGGAGPNDQQATTTEKEETVELNVAGEPTKVYHVITSEPEHTTQSGRTIPASRTESYFVILDNWNNDFGWLGVGASGPADKFDLEGFKAFLASLKKK